MKKTLCWDHRVFFHPLLQDFRSLQLKLVQMHHPTPTRFHGDPDHSHPHQCFLLEMCLPHPARERDTCSPYGLDFKHWDLKLDKNVMDLARVSLIVCAVSHSSRYKPDGGMSNFRETVIFVTIFTNQIWIKDGIFFFVIDA